MNRFSLVILFFSQKMGSLLESDPDKSSKNRPSRKHILSYLSSCPTPRSVCIAQTAKLIK